MANTPDPRDFYRVRREVRMPSLWREPLGRVTVEAIANVIPVLASDRGALPETPGDAGFVLTIPERTRSRAEGERRSGARRAAASKLIQPPEAGPRCGHQA
jgi:glycosyltransferase involved in cell wall biosynthesis